MVATRKRRKAAKVYHRSAKSGGRDDWRTPAPVLTALRSQWVIGLDPCASDWPAYHFAAINLDARADGLARSWGPLVRGGGGVAFTNWPYSVSPAWSAKVIEEAHAGTPIITLSAARPGAAWYRSLKRCADAVGECHGRLRFLLGDEPEAPSSENIDEDTAELYAEHPGTIPAYIDKPTDSAPFPSAIMGFNVSWRRFFAAFESIAACEVPR